MRITRIAVSGLVLAAIALAGAGTASAEPTPPPGPVTITLSPEQVGLLCERLAKVDTRASKLIDRINGGPDVKGSTGWLKARAKQERDAGRETSAQLLEERAERRAGKVDKLNKVKAFASEFKTKYCGGK